MVCNKIKQLKSNQVTELVFGDRLQKSISGLVEISHMPIEANSQTEIDNSLTILKAINKITMPDKYSMDNKENQLISGPKPMITRLYYCKASLTKPSNP